MEDTKLEVLKYPIGHFEYSPIVGKETIDNWIRVLEELPTSLKNLVNPLTSEQLDTPYRHGGWTIRQVVHHMADSHHHSYTRFKWALTESEPLIKAYDEKNWSNLIDAKTAPIALSLDYITALHAKLVYLLRGLSPADMDKYYIHPENNLKISVKENIGKYAWHSRHHCAHIQGLIVRNSW